MLELGPRTMAWQNPLFLRAVAVEVLQKNSGQVFRGFANVCWLVKGTSIPDGTSCPHPTGDGSCRKSVTVPTNIRNRRLFMLNIFFDATPKGSSKKSFEYWHVRRFFKYWVCFLWAAVAIVVFTLDKASESGITTEFRQPYANIFDLFD